MMGSAIFYQFKLRDFTSFLRHYIGSISLTIMLGKIKMAPYPWKLSMSTRTLIIFAIVILIAMGAVLVSNIFPHLAHHTNEKYIRLNDIRGMAIRHKGLDYTLNFDQQNEVALLLNNSSTFAEKASPNLNNAPFEKIAIYGFDKPAIEITPSGFDGQNLVFSAPAWSPHLLVESSNGTLKNILLNTYDE